MKLAYSTNAYMRFPIEEAIERIAALGYAGIEIMADIPHAWPAETTDDQIDRMRAALNRHGLVISNINAFMMNAVGDFWHPSWIESDESQRRQRIEHTIKALRLARRLGAPSITTEPGGPLAPGQSRADALDLFAEGIGEALVYAAQERVTLLVEPEPQLLIETMDEFLEFADRFDSPWFGLNFDVGHFYCVGEDLSESVKRARRMTRHYHFEDIAASRVHEHLVPGHGAIDFDSLLAAIDETGYEGWATVELYPYLDDPDAAGREAREFLLSKMST